MNGCRKGEHSSLLLLQQWVTKKMIARSQCWGRNQTGCKFLQHTVVYSILPDGQCNSKECWHVTQQSGQVCMSYDVNQLHLRTWFASSISPRCCRSFSTSIWSSFFRKFRNFLSSTGVAHTADLSLELALDTAPVTLLLNSAWILDIISSSSSSGISVLK